MRKPVGFTLTKKGYAVADLLLSDPKMDINHALELVELEGIGEDPASRCGGLTETAHA